MGNILQKMGSATPQRPARLTANQLEAGLWIARQHHGAGYDCVGTHELKTYVDTSFDPKRNDDYIVKRFGALKNLRDLHFLLGKIGYDLCFRVCVSDERVRGKYENELLKQCLTLVYKELILPSVDK